MVGTARGEARSPWPDLERAVTCEPTASGVRVGRWLAAQHKLLGRHLVLLLGHIQQAHPQSARGGFPAAAVAAPATEAAAAYHTVQALAPAEGAGAAASRHVALALTKATGTVGGQLWSQLGFRSSCCLPHSPQIPSWERAEAKARTA